MSGAPLFCPYRVDSLKNKQSTNCLFHIRHYFPFVYLQNIANISQNLAWVCAAPFQFHVSMRMSKRDMIDKHKTLPIVSCLKTFFIQWHKRHTVMSHSLPWLLPKISLGSYHTIWQATAVTDRKQSHSFPCFISEDWSFCNIFTNPLTAVPNPTNWQMFSEIQGIHPWIPMSAEPKTNSAASDVKWERFTLPAVRETSCPEGVTQEARLVDFRRQ